MSMARSCDINESEMPFLITQYIFINPHHYYVR